MKRNILLIFIGPVTVFAAGCVDNSSPGNGTPSASVEGYNPAIDPANFVKDIDNPYFPLKPGTTFIYEGITENEDESLAPTSLNQSNVCL
jgi:hypothetical protein